MKMKKTQILLFNIFIYLVLTNPVLSQEKTGFAIDPSANNIAVLFTMTDESGRTRNLDLIESVFEDGALGFKSQRYHNVSSPFIYNKLTEIAKNLDDNATLLCYFNSHGGGSGSRFIMSAKGGNFKFSKALDAIKKGKKVKRLIFLVDTCHAEGSIQDATGQDGELLKNLRDATPTDFLPELPDTYDSKDLPFTASFIESRLEKRGYKTYRVTNRVIDYGQESGAYDEILIISSSSVEKVSYRGVFASRLNSTFQKVKEDNEVTVKQFLKKFADSHSKSGQQPHYKLLPSKTMLEEPLFGPWLAQVLPIIENGERKELGYNFIPMPSK